MKVHDLHPAPGSTKPKRRVGRGIGGKGGKTAGRGTKGQGARNNIKPGFEGGQLPLAMRVPMSATFRASGFSFGSKAPPISRAICGAACTPSAFS